MMPHFEEFHTAFRAGQPLPEFDKEKINAELAKLPDGPDEQLR